MDGLGNAVSNQDNLNEEAVNWLITNTTKCHSDSKTVQRYSLAIFYEATNGKQWFNNLDWLSEKDECEWFGVNCNTEGLVVEVDLSKCQKGFLFLSVYSQAYLISSIKISDENFVSGTIPSEFMSGIPSLESIQLYNNRLSGKIPNSLSSLSNLDMLDLEGNVLTGMVNLDDLLYSANTLKSLRLSFNSLEGNLTNRIHEFVQLRELWLANNSMSGRIPTQICQLRKLGKYLSFLFPLITTHITHFTSVDSIYLYKNNFSGPLPECLGNLTKVESFDISHNTIGGALPESIGNMYSLKRLHLSHISLTGSIPSSVSNLHRLQSFVANSNKITGVLPDMSKLDKMSK